MLLIPNYYKELGIAMQTFVTTQTVLLVLFKIQRWIRRRDTIVQIVRSTRNIIHFGPWRKAVLAWKRRGFDPSRYAQALDGSVLGPDLDVAAVVSAVEAKGFSLGCRLPPDLIAQLQELTTRLGDGSHVEMHRRYSIFDKIARNSDVLQVVRQYFGCEPFLIECKLFVDIVGKDDPLSSGFHFDHAGARSLNMLVYLTDVDSDTAPHVVIQGTQTGKRLWDFFREYIPVNEMKRRFPGRIKTITGPAGTVIFENTEMFHMRQAGTKRRALLNIVYSTRGKRLLSLGRDMPRVWSRESLEINEPL